MKIKSSHLMALVLLIVLLSSCVKPYVEIEYTLECSESLLEYATPHVTHNQNGNIVSFSIAESDWKPSSSKSNSSVKITVNGETIEKSNNVIKEWKKNVKYDNFSVVDDEITVIYELKANIPEGGFISGGFYHNLSLLYKMRDENGNDITGPKIISNSTSIIVGKHDDLVTEIKSYKDYIGNHFVSSGTVSSLSIY